MSSINRPRHTSGCGAEVSFDQSPFTYSNLLKVILGHQLNQSTMRECSKSRA